jgi:hypothetical protein
MNKIVLYLNMFLIILNVQKDYRITGITGIELGKHAHHMNPS